MSDWMKLHSLSAATRANDDADHLGVDGRCVELVRIDAGRVDEVAASSEACLEFEQRSARHGVHCVLDGEHPGGRKQEVVPDQVPRCDRESLAGAELCQLGLNG